MRRLFNEAGIHERALAGELSIRLVRPRAVAPDHFEPAGTISVALEYYTHDDERIAVAHAYIRVDGSYGASGRPDPKWLLVNGAIYIVAH